MRHSISFKSEINNPGFKPGFILLHTHSIVCMCHSIRTMFRVLGIYNFASRQQCGKTDCLKLTSFDTCSLKTCPSIHIFSAQAPRYVLHQFRNGVRNNSMISPLRTPFPKWGVHIPWGLYVQPSRS